MLFLKSARFGASGLPLAFMLGLAPDAVSAADQPTSLSYTAAEADAGQPLYQTHCSAFHGENLTDGQAPPLAGDAFQAKWSGKSYLTLFTEVRATMPTTAPASLSATEYANILAYTFRRNAFHPGRQALPTRPREMSLTMLPGPTSIHGLEPAIALPPPPNPTANPLADLTKITEEKLRHPDPEDWLSWRGTPTAMLACSSQRTGFWEGRVL